MPAQTVPQLDWYRMVNKQHKQLTCSCILAYFISYRGTTLLHCSLLSFFLFSSDNNLKKCPSFWCSLLQSNLATDSWWLEHMLSRVIHEVKSPSAIVLYIRTRGMPLVQSNCLVGTYCCIIFCMWPSVKKVWTILVWVALPHPTNRADLIPWMKSCCLRRGRQDDPGCCVWHHFLIHVRHPHFCLFVGLMVSGLCGWTASKAFQESQSWFDK